MTIQKLSIQNFRGIDHLELDFSHPETGKPQDFIVLAGPNGCGKTSVLQAILLAMSDGNLLGGENPKKYSRNKTNDPTVSITLDNGEGRNWPIPGRYIPQRRPMPVESKRNFVYFSSWREPNLVGALALNTGKKGKSPDDNEANRLWRLKEHLINLTAMKGFEPGDESKRAEQAALGQLNEIWQLFYPASKEKFVTRRAATPQDAKDDMLFDLFLSTGSDSAIPVDDLSSGELEVLSMLGTLTVLRKQKPDIVLIDEPELHLHPSWHRSIIQALKDMLPETQIICTTHSVKIQEMALSCERFILLREDDPRAKAWRLETPDHDVRQVAEVEGKYE